MCEERWHDQRAVRLRELELPAGLDQKVVPTEVQGA